jgi:hypothetical protein
MISASKYPTHEDFYALDADTTKQTIEESNIALSVDMGAFTVHHGTRYGRPIVIAEHHNQKADELSAVWYSDVPVSF